MRDKKRRLLHLRCGSDKKADYQQLKQFAVFADGITDDDLASTIRVFRNAADDESTQNGTDSYLTGSLEGDLSDPASTANYSGYIYWTGSSGSRKVILRKVEKDTYKSIEGAVFTIHKGNSSDAYTPKGETEPLTNLHSKASGVFWIGTLPYGVYYLHETTVPSGYTGHGTSEGRWFFMVVGDDTVAGSRDGVVMSTGYADRDAAKAAYDSSKAGTTP